MKKKGKLLLNNLQNNMNLLFISIILFIASYFLLKKSKNNLIIFCVFIFIYFLLTGFFLISNYFTWKWVDESVIYHLFYWLDWAWFWADLKLIIFWFIILIIWIIFPILVYFFTKKTEQNLSIYKKIFFIILFFWAFFIHPLAKNFYDLTLVTSAPIEELKQTVPYVKPEVEKKWETTKNIVYIYLESFEQTFTDENIFPWLTPNLNKLKQEAIVFDNLKQAYWTSWTIAWMTWSQCWIPLRTSWWWGNSMWWMTDFLPWAFCLWDFLKKADYELSYVWWANLEFAGKWNFYKTHSFDNLSWKKELEAKLEDKNYINSWWLYDDSLFDFVFEEYERLSSKEWNFWLFTLTLDTHWDKWVISKTCENLYDSENIDNILNAYHCSDFLVWQLVEKIRNHKNFKNTIIVISSDHYAMKSNNNYSTLEENSEKRRNLFMILDSENQVISKNSITLDIAPTILDRLWFEIDKFWLWMNLFKNFESFSDDYLSEIKLFFETFWTYPTVKNGIDFDVDNKKIFLDWKELKLPTLIYLNSKFDTEKILWDDDWDAFRLKENILENSIFIWRAKWWWIYVEIKKQDWTSKIFVIKENKKISFEEILQYLK